MTTPSLTDPQQSAFDIMRSMLNQYNLASLAPVLRDLIVGGISDQAELSLRLQDTQEWKTRFAGNEKLRAQGLPVLSVGEYLSAEKSYAQVMKNYGLPQGFYDDPADFADFIGKSVSPNEIAQRAQMASDIARREDPAVRAQLESMGLGHGDITAYMMDASRALPLIQQKYQTSLIGAAARRSGLTPDNATAAHLADIGVSEQQAIQGYGQIAGELPLDQLAAHLYGEHITQADLESETFDGNGAVTATKKRLASQERAAFGGSAGTTQGREGSLRRSPTGQY